MSDLPRQPRGAVDPTFSRDVPPDRATAAAPRRMGIATHHAGQVKDEPDIGLRREG